jgi:hypothetical protein
VRGLSAIGEWRGDTSDWPRRVEFPLALQLHENSCPLAVMVIISNRRKKSFRSSNGISCHRRGHSVELVSRNHSHSASHQHDLPPLRMSACPTAVRAGAQYPAHSSRCANINPHALALPLAGPERAAPGPGTRSPSSNGPPPPIPPAQAPGPLGCDRASGSWVLAA